jgi:hypothetical protein
LLLAVNTSERDIVLCAADRLASAAIERKVWICILGGGDGTSGHELNLELIRGVDKK